MQGNYSIISNGVRPKGPVMDMSKTGKGFTICVLPTKNEVQGREKAYSSSVVSNQY